MFYLFLTVMAAAMAFLSGEALAHTSQRAILMLLPTAHYLIGGAAAVAITFAVLAFVPARALERLFGRGGEKQDRAPPAPKSWHREAVSGLSFLAFAFLIYAGFAGSRDPLANPLPLTVWTLGWVGLTLAHALLGNLWAWINPWSGPYRALTGLFNLRPRATLPSEIGYLPALAGLFAIGWFELVSLAPADPARLAWAAGLYWAINFFAMLIFGETAWRARGECLSVLFRFLAQLSPLARNRDGLLAAQALPLSAVFFIALALATVSFDGLSKTFWYLDLIGINPLAFPGRSAVMKANTFGLALTFAVMAGLYCLCAGLGARIAGARETWAGAGRWALALLPILLAYHFAHYLTVLLINLQYALAAANDPLSRGANLLGLEHFHVAAAVLNDHEAVAIIWNLVAGAIIAGHLWAVVLSHGIALRMYATHRRAVLSQIPLAILMVAYTLFGLWLMSTPTGA